MADASAAPPARPSVQLVVAHCTEDLGWLAQVPEDIGIVVYNKSTAPDAAAAQLPPRAALHTLPNRGREADTYLSYIIEHYDDLPDVAIFAQGHPFEHSPDFLGLLGEHARALYRTPVQPLSNQWKTKRNVPPAHVLEQYTSGNIRLQDGAELRVCAHPISAHTLDMLRFHDEGARNIHTHGLRALHLRNGASIVGAVLAHANLPCGHVGEVVYVALGAQFAVTRDAVRRHPREAYVLLRQLNLRHSIMPWIMERCWMTLFGFQPRGDEHIHGSG